MPVYTMNNKSRPTKVVPVGGDFRNVYPRNVDFSKFKSFARVEDGTIVNKNAFQQGLPVEAEHLPRQLKWGHGELKKGLLDLLMHHSIFIASENLRRVVEQHDPGVHQFVPVEITWKNGGSSIPYYWLYPCNRIDSIHGTLSTYKYVETAKSWHHRPEGKLVFDLQKIGNVHMWLDRGYSTTDGIMISQTLKDAFEAAGLTGSVYFERETV